MSKRTVQEFIEQNIAVTFRSRKEKEDFFVLCDKSGIQWSRGGSIIDPSKLGSSHYTYPHLFDEGGMMFASRWSDWEYAHRYTLVPASDFLGEARED